MSYDENLFIRDKSFELIKLIATLSSGSIVVISSLLNKFQGTEYPAFLVLALALFGVSTLCGITAYATLNSDKYNEQAPRYVGYSYVSYLLGLVSLIVYFSINVLS